MVSINFVGDVALFKVYEQNNCDPFSNIKLPDSLFNVANFEFPIPCDGATKKFYDVDENYRVSDSFSRQLNIKVFDLYSLANNHILDYGVDGIACTIEKITSVGSKCFGVGKEKFNPLVCEIGGLRFVFVAFVKSGRWDRAVGEVGPDPYNMEGLIELIEAYKANHDHIVVFPHWGTELVDTPDPLDVVNARKLIDAGASCVIGHHPHISQGIETYKGGIIAYSLGSFIYLPDFEKGNTDRAPERDISICLSVEFSKKVVIKHTPYKYMLDRAQLIPVCKGDFRNDVTYSSLCSNIGNKRRYSQKVRTVLIRRELVSFVFRFKSDPFRATVHYLKYIKLKHLKKILGRS